MKRVKKMKWDAIREKVMRGEFPSVFIAGDGRLALEGRGATLPADIAALYPAEIRAQAEAKASERKAESDAKFAEQRALRTQADAEIEKLRHVRCWRLAGFYIEDQSMARYTLAEIDEWVHWDSQNLKMKHPSVIAQADNSGIAPLCVDFSGYFEEVCGGRVPATRSHDALCRRLAAFIDEQKVAASSQN
ncbi:MAG TPA: hypothetical protein VIH42_04200 [Thermoguttaceae bacterium]